MHWKLFITVVSQYCDDSEDKDEGWLHNHNKFTGATTYTLFRVGIPVVKCVKNDAPGG
jgi:hypothetical protein